MIIRQKRCKQVLLTLLSAGFVVVSLHLLTGDFTDSHYAQRHALLIVPAGICGTLFFSITTLLLFYNLFKTNVILFTDEKGFTTRLGFIPWEEVIRISLCTIGKQKFIGIEIKHVKKLLKANSWYQRKLIRANMAFGYPPITLSLNTTQTDIHVVISEMQKHIAHN